MVHVTSAANRRSILKHGLDWSHMGPARGIAGGRGPEIEGVFICRNEFEAEWFADMNNTGGPVDVWAIEGVNDDELIEAPHGYCYVSRPISPDRLTLVRRDVPPRWTD